METESFSADHVRKFLSQFVCVRVYEDKKSGRKISEGLKIKSPGQILLDPAGRVVIRHYGKPEESQFEAWYVDKLMRIACEDLGNPDKTLKDVAKAFFQMQVWFPETSTFKGVEHQLVKRQKEAEFQVEWTLLQADHEQMLALHRGHGLLRGGKKADAIDAYKEAVSKDPASAMAEEARVVLKKLGVKVEPAPKAERSK